MMDCTDCSITYNILRIREEEISSLRTFYEDVLGMVYTKEDSYPKKKRHLFKFPNQELATGICFEEFEGEGKLVKVPRERGYWKIGIAVYDVNAAAKHIKSKTNVEMTEGKQFWDICFAVHLKDPAGYIIELLQHSFEENFKPSIESEKSFLGQPKSLPPCLSQISLDIKDPKRACNFYTNILGMRLVGVIPNREKKFTLYFFAYTNVKFPKEDEPGKREWIWQQPFAQIEIRHRHGVENKLDFNYITNDTDGVIGHGGYCIEVSKKKYEYITYHAACRDIVAGKRMVIRDPNRYAVEILCKEN